MGDEVHHILAFVLEDLKILLSDTSPDSLPVEGSLAFGFGELLLPKHLTAPGLDFAGLALLDEDLDHLFFDKRVLEKSSHGAEQIVVLFGLLY